MKRTRSTSNNMNEDTINFDDVEVIKNHNLFNMDESGIDLIVELNEAENRMEASRSKQNLTIGDSKNNTRISQKNDNSKGDRIDTTGHGMNTSSKIINDKNKTTLSTHDRESYNRNISNNQNDYDLCRDDTNHDNVNIINKLKSPEKSFRSKDSKQKAEYSNEILENAKRRAIESARRSSIGELNDPTPFKFQHHAKKSLPNAYQNTLRGMTLAREELGLIVSSNENSPEKNDLVANLTKPQEQKFKNNMILHEQSEKSESKASSEALKILDKNHRLVKKP